MKLSSAASPVAIGAIALLMMLPSSTFAQIEAPEMPTGGLFGRRSTPDPKVVTQEMTVTLNTGSGYDRNSIAGDEAGDPGLFGPQQSGRVSFGSATLGYRWGRATRYLEANGSGYTSYATAGVNQVWNGNTAIRAATELGRRIQLQGGARAELTPLYLFSALASSEGGSVAPETGGLQPQGVTEQKWLGRTGMLNMQAQLARRQRASVSYEVSARRPIEGLGLNGRMQLVSATHDWQPTRTLSIQSEYRFTDHQQSAEDGGENLLTTHSASIGINGERQLSATRAVSYSLTGGATHAYAAYSAGIPSDFVFANFSASLRFPLTRSWALTVASARAATVLQGYAPEVFIVEDASIDVRGNLSRRVQLRTEVRYATGNSDSGAAAFDSASASIHGQVAVTRRFAFFAAYGYYDHLLRNLIVVQPNFPDRYRRHSFWAGTTVWLPVFGRF